MSRFIVKFFKNVMNDNGHGAEICQEVLEIDAPDADDAVERGKLKFCEDQHSKHWSLRADRISVRPADFPS